MKTERDKRRNIRRKKYKRIYQRENEEKGRKDK